MNEYKGKTLSWQDRRWRRRAGAGPRSCQRNWPRHAGRFGAFYRRAARARITGQRADYLQRSRKRDFPPARICANCMTQAQQMDAHSAAKGVREFLERIHAVLNRLDTSPLTTIAAVHGVCFGGGFELALTCDLIIADKMARFCFPGIAAGTYPRIRRHSATEARYRQRRGARSAAHRAQHQRHQGAFRGPREPGCLPRAKPCAWRARPPRRSQNSIARPPRPRSVSSSRCLRKNCAAKSTFSATSSRARR